jgi:hypothetical protein
MRSRRTRRGNTCDAASSPSEQPLERLPAVSSNSSVRSRRRRGHRGRAAVDQNPRTRTPGRGPRQADPGCDACRGPPPSRRAPFIVGSRRARPPPRRPACGPGGQRAKRPAEEAPQRERVERAEAREAADVVAVRRPAGLEFGERRRSSGRGRAVERRREAARGGGAGARRPPRRCAASARTPSECWRETMAANSVRLSESRVAASLTRAVPECAPPSTSGISPSASPGPRLATSVVAVPRGAAP